MKTNTINKNDIAKLFKWKHFLPEIILLCIRWYLKYKLSFRNLVEMMLERGLSIVHTTIMRWTHQFSPVINKRIRKYLKANNRFISAG